MKDPFKTAPKKKPSSAAKKRVLSIKTDLPKEHEPATTAEPKTKPKKLKPKATKPTRTQQPEIQNQNPNPNQNFEETKLLPIKVTLTLDDRMELAKASEAIKRRVTGQRKFSKTDLVNEAILNWLNQNGY